MPTIRRESRSIPSLVERLREMTTNAKAEYLPSFSMEEVVKAVGKVAEEAAQRGLYCAEYLLYPPSGSLQPDTVREELTKRLAAIYTEARVYDPEVDEMDFALYDGVWVVGVSWKPAEPASSLFKGDHE